MKRSIIIKYTVTIMALVLVVIQVQAQESAPTAGAADETLLTWVLNNLFLILGVIVFLAGCFSIFSVFDRMMRFEEMKLLADKGLLTESSALKVKKESLWQRLSKKAWNITPIEKEKDILLEHPHDGIYELDNNLPPWWLALFYGSIIFAFAYIGYQHFSKYGKSMEEEYQIAMEQGELEVAQYLAGQSNLVDETNVTLLTDEAKLAEGAKIFKERCVACHGALGEGGIGPNMTDEYWLHGGDIKDVFRVVKYGVSGKGMQAWKDEFTAGQIHKVSSYILSLQGTNPPNGKEAQGDLHKAK